MILGAVPGAVDFIGGLIGGGAPRWTGVDQINSFITAGNWEAVQQIADSGYGPWNPGDPLHQYDANEQQFARAALARRSPGAQVVQAGAAVAGGMSPLMWALLALGALAAWKTLSARAG